MGMVSTVERAATPPPVRLDQPPVRIADNKLWQAAKARFSIVIAFRREDPRPLLDALCKLPGAESGEVIVYDDGACDREQTDALTAMAEDAPCAVRLLTAGIPIGKARARNILAGHCRAEWILMLEAEALPANTDFLSRYAEIARGATPPSLVIGGFSKAPPPRNARCALHHHHSARFECLPAEQRNRRAIRHLHVGNALFHRDIFAACRFDELFRGRGWEGVDWGLRVARNFPIQHVDNPLVRSRFDNDFELLMRYRRSAPNFARLVAWHPNAVGRSPLVRAALLAKRLPFRAAFARLAGQVALSSSLSVSVRAKAFKAWRALTYASAL